MKFRQLVCFDQVIRQDFNVSAAAKQLFTSQSGVSKQLQSLVDELGVELFRHSGKRLVGLTEPGAQILPVAREILRDIENIQAIASRHARPGRPELRLASTRHAAQHLVRGAVSCLRERIPGLHLQLSEHDPQQVYDMVSSGEVDLGILPEQRHKNADLIYLPMETWHLALAAPSGHPLTNARKICLEDLSQYPLCSYNCRSASYQLIDETFKAQGLPTPVELALSDTQSIIDFVQDGAGVGIVAEGAREQVEAAGLSFIACPELLPSLTTFALLPRGAEPQRCVLALLETLTPSFSQDEIAGILDEPRAGHDPRGTTTR